MSDLVDMIDLFLREQEETREKKRKRKFKPTGDPGLEKDGGKRGNRLSYSSGRRELVFGMRRKKFVDFSSDLKKDLGIRQSDTNKRSLSGTGHGSKHRWRKF